MRLATINGVTDSIAMKFRGLAIPLVVLVLAAASGARAADCVEAREGHHADGRNAVELMPVGRDCGPLRIVERQRNDAFATYPLFDPARGEAERRYNEWASTRAEEIDGTAGAVTVTLYRSRNLLSARMANWFCCGTQGAASAAALNIDSRTGRDVRLGDLVDLARVADRCWQAFSQLEAPIPGQGMLFRQSYPRGRFAGLVPDAVWSANAHGLRLEFGGLLGFVGLDLTCEVPTDELAKVAKPGIAIPF